MKKVLLFTILVIISLFGCVSSQSSIPEYQEVVAVPDCYYYNGHTYIYIKKATDWDNANNLCSKTGGYLLTVGDKYENSFIMEIFTDDTWLGLSDTIIEGNFRWTNGEPYSFKFWGAKNPDNWKNEDYACYWNEIAYRWNDTTYDNFHSNAHFICEFDFKITDIDTLKNIKSYLTGEISNIDIVTKEENPFEPETVTINETTGPTDTTEKTNVDISELPLVTVIDFKIESISESEGNLIVDMMISALTNTKRFRVLDRSQRDNILKEMEFSLSDCVDESCQIEIGRLLAADQIIVGSIGKVGTRFMLDVKLIEVTTGITISTKYDVFASVDDLVDGIKPIVQELSRG